jgi:hypothetical protein
MTQLEKDVRFLKMVVLGWTVGSFLGSILAFVFRLINWI